jgi:hypothetical protein
VVKFSQAWSDQRQGIGDLKFLVCGQAKNPVMDPKIRKFPHSDSGRAKLKKFELQRFDFPTLVAKTTVVC